MSFADILFITLVSILIYVVLTLTRRDRKGPKK